MAEEMARTPAQPPAAVQTRRAIEDLEVILGKHDIQLDNFAKDVGDVKSEVATLNTKFDSLAQSINALTLAINRSPFDINKMLQAAVYGTALIGAFVSCIIYITNNHFAADWATAKLESTQNRILIMELRDDIKLLKQKVVVP